MKKNQSDVKLISLRGIGESVASKLISFYGSETVAVQTIAKGKIFSLMEAGLSEKIALKIVRSYKNSITGEENDDSLQTQDVNQIYSKLIKLIQQYALTSYGKSKILVDFYPTQNMTRVGQNRGVFKTAISITKANNQNIGWIMQNLQDFKPLELIEDFEVKRRIILTTIPEVLKSLKSLKITSYCQVELISSFEELKDYNLSEELLLLLTEHDFDESYFPGILTLPENVLEHPWINIIPEKIMNFFISNLKTLNKAIEITRAIVIDDQFRNMFPILQDENLQRNLKILESILQKINSDGSLKNEINPELNRLSTILNSFEDVVYHYQAELNELLRREKSPRNTKSK